jgi:hypothetical protein
MQETIAILFRLESPAGIIQNERTYFQAKDKLIGSYNTIGYPVYGKY